MPWRPDVSRDARLVISLLLEIAALLLVLLAVLGFGIVMGKEGGALFKALWGGVGGFAGVLAAYSHRLARQIIVMPADILRTKDKRRPVFYLRSYLDDQRTREIRSTDIPMIQSLSTEQEHLEKALRRIGPVVGGTPAENKKLPQLGFSPVYMARDKWQATVSNIMQESILVVLRIAKTDGVLWEFEESVSKVQPERLLFLVPSRTDYEAFRELALARKLFPIELPDYRAARRPPKSTVSAIVYFKPDRRPCFVPLEIPSWRGETLTAALIHAMWPVYEQIGVPWRPAPVSWVKLLMAAYGILMLGLLAYIVITPANPIDLTNPDQTACSFESQTGEGRSRLKLSLPEAARARCCAKYPWLQGC